MSEEVISGAAVALYSGGARVIYRGDGEVVSFPVPFDVESSAESGAAIRVYSAGDSDFADLQEVPGSAWTYTASGGVLLTTAPGSDTRLVIMRDTPISRRGIYTAGGQLTAASLNGDLDRLTMIAQDLREAYRIALDGGAADYSSRAGVVNVTEVLHRQVSGAVVSATAAASGYASGAAVQASSAATQASVAHINAVNAGNNAVACLQNANRAELWGSQASAAKIAAENAAASISSGGYVKSSGARVIASEVFSSGGTISGALIVSGGAAVYAPPSPGRSDGGFDSTGSSSIIKRVIDGNYELGFSAEFGEGYAGDRAEVYFNNRGLDHRYSVGADVEGVYASLYEFNECDGLVRISPRAFMTVAVSDYANGNAINLNMSGGGIYFDGTEAVGEDLVRRAGNVMLDHMQVGDYLLTFTSSGGLLVSGGGVQFQVSSGAVIASGTSGESVVLSGGRALVSAHDDDAGGQYIDVTPDGGVTINAEGPDRKVLIMQGGAIGIEVGADYTLISGRPVMTALTTATYSETTVVSGGVLSGGTSYIYTQPLTVLDIASVTSDCDATIKFTAGAGLTGIGLPSSCYFTGESAFTSGAHYLAAFNGADVVVIQQQKLDEA